MRERLEPVDLPGLPPLLRVTFLDDDGNPLPFVEYRLRPPDAPRPPRDHIGVALLVAGSLLAIVLSTALFIGP